MVAVIDRKRLGLTIAYARYRNGLTQDELADMTGLSRRAVSRIEHGNDGVPVSKVAVVAKALNIPFDHDNVEDAVRERARYRQHLAWQIRAELVCCDVYERDHGTERAGTRHAICFWGEAAARIVEYGTDL